MSPPGIRSPPSISCTMSREAAAVGEAATARLRPDSFGRFGKFGGKYVPETLMHALTELEEAFHSLAKDEDFQVIWSCFWSFRIERWDLDEVWDSFSGVFVVVFMFVS